jgi:uracil-DNA glycosylase
VPVPPLTAAEAPQYVAPSGGLSRPSPLVEARPGATRPVWGPPAEAVGRADDWRGQLAALGAEAAGCTACGLCKTRHKVVFGTGSGVVPLVFVGEAPGHDEDLSGEPFVGRAGQLLTKIIEAIGLSRDQVYICNVLKCRPPDNRNPLPEEIASCRRFLESQLDLLRPKVICTLGLFAAQLLLGSTMPIGKLRGRLNTEGRWPILPTFHPAYLLRNPSAKATVWEDVQLVRRILDG